VVPYEDQSPVVPDGMAIRRMRRRRGWSRRALVEAIAEASFRASGLRDSVSVNVLGGIEEACEPVPYSALCLVAAGLDCNPIEIVRDPSSPTRSRANPAPKLR